jgi:hypothetical protein
MTPETLPLLYQIMKVTDLGLTIFMPFLPYSQNQPLSPHLFHFVIYITLIFVLHVCNLQLRII